MRDHTLNLVATRALRYDGKPVKAGEAFTARNSAHALVLTTSGQARAADAPPRAPRGTYQTADLTAEQPADETPTDEDEPPELGTPPADRPAGVMTMESVQPPRKRRGSYKRRDLRAKE